MGVLITDVMLDRVKDQGVQIAIPNGSGIRSGLDGGKLTMGEVLTVCHFEIPYQLSKSLVLPCVPPWKMVSAK